MDMATEHPDAGEGDAGQEREERLEVGGRLLSPEDARLIADFLDTIPMAGRNKAPAEQVSVRIVSPPR